ncbi:pyruvate kinase 1 [Populus alba x Populus x berolinensis]|nr:pyruvate kinase 1 [Populus alba x Populus x berolinensis]
MAGKPAVDTRVVDSMTENLRPTRAEATDVATAILDGSHAILLGVETLRGLYPMETISTVGRICAEGDDMYWTKAFSESTGASSQCFLALVDINSSTFVVDSRKLLVDF